MDKKLKRYKVGIDSETFAISLVDEPAIEENFVYMKKEQKQQIFMQSDEKHMLYGAVLVPDKDIYRIDEDGNEFYLSFTKESIERMSQDFMKNYRQYNVTVQHEEQANEITIVESWLKSDLQYDKSVALGLNEDLPVGTWFVGMKCNNIDLWEQVKDGVLNGFSVESLISIEEFNKQINDVMDNESFWTKMKNMLKEVFSMKQEEQTIQMEEQVDTVEEPTTETVEQPKAEEVEEPTTETVEESKTGEEVESNSQETPETPKEEVKNSPQDEIIKNLLEEVKALKEQISELNIKPSAKPINVQSNAVSGDSYKQWRERIRKYM